MLIALHKQARTTPAVRAEIAASTESIAALTRRHDVTEATVRKWRARSSFEDRSHTAHRLQTTLTKAQAAVVVELRRTLLLPLDDLLAMVREFICQAVSHSAMDRCLRRHGVGNLDALTPQPARAPHRPFKAYVPGFINVDVKFLPQMADESRVGATCSWPSTGPRAGSTSTSRPTRPPRAPPRLRQHRQPQHHAGSLREAVQPPTSSVRPQGDNGHPSHQAVVRRTA